MMPELFEFATGHYISLCDQFLVGRALECSYIIAELLISRHHCKFTTNDGKWYITDLSSNGIYVNDRKITPNTPFELHHHDTIEFSTYLFGFKLQRDPDVNYGDVEIINLDNTATAVNQLEAPANPPLVPTTDVKQSEQPPQVVTVNTVASNDSKIDDELTCSICSELFISAVTVNCQHSFCELCILTWMKNSKNCPICRQVITSQASSITINNLVSLVVAKKTEEEKATRKVVVAERKTEFQRASKSPPARGGRRRGRTRGARITRPAPTPTGASRRGRTRASNPPPRQDVINISSSDYSEPDTLSDSDSDTDMDIDIDIDIVNSRIIMGPLRLDH